MTNIKLIGISGDCDYESWLEKVSKVLQGLRIRYKFEEVNEVDEIIRFNIQAIPALIIDDAVVIEQNNHMPDIEEFKSSILGYFGTKGFY
jgi:thioredoxin family protein